MKSEISLKTADIPLIVNLDGTLIHSRLTWEAVTILLRKDFIKIFLFPFWLLRGVSHLKKRLNETVDVDVTGLSYDKELIEFIILARAEGRIVVLATDADQKIANALADHLGIFDEVQAGDANFSGKIKAQRLLNKYGRYGFDYIGNSRIDIPVWRYSRTVYCVKGLSVSLGEDRVCKFVGMTRHHWFPGLITASRPRQWLKNLLVFVPILANHSLNVKSALYSLLAFIVFCLCASSAYLLNDALDAGDDRFHPTKHSRPIANGSLPIHIALLCSAILGLAGLALAGYFIFSLFIVVAIYFISTMAYSLCFKRLMMIDIVVLAMLYSIRVLGGGAATDIRPSFWLIAFSFFMFLSLALLKRYSELHTLHLRGKQRIKGRGYRTLDQAVVAIMGTSSIFVSILVFMLYMNSPNVSALYPNPTYLFAIVPLLVFWAGRLWILAGRGEVNDDPILYVSRDATSLVVIVCCFAFATAASI